MDEKNKSLLFPLNSECDVLGKKEFPKFESFKPPLPESSTQKIVYEDINKILSDETESLETEKSGSNKKRKRYKETKNIKKKSKEYLVEEKLKNFSSKKWLPEDFIKFSDIYEYCYLDKTGDEGNLRYKSIYITDIPRYKQRALLYPPSQKEINTSSIRYFNRSQIASLNSRKFRRIKFTPFLISAACQSNKVDLEQKISMEVDIEWLQRHGGRGLKQETNEEWVIEKTKEYNIRVRECPQDLNIWLKFADFQEEAIRATRRKVPQRSLLEKKASILEKALDYHPSSDIIISKLLDIARNIEDSKLLESRFKSALSKFPLSLTLWSEWLLYKKSNFTIFSVTAMRETYEEGLAAMVLEREKRNGLVLKEEGDSQAETKIITLFLERVQFEIQTGYFEKAIFLIQAMFEWNFFSPDNKDALAPETLLIFFQSYWFSDFPKFGSDTSIGFSAYLEKEIFEINLVKPKSKKETDEEKENVKEKESVSGGWSGWYPLSKLEETNLLGFNPEIGSSADSDSGSEHSANEEDKILQELELKFDVEMERLENEKSVPSHILEAWMEEERKRSNFNTIPKPVITTDSDEKIYDTDFDDIKNCLIYIESEKARNLLIIGFLKICGIETDNLISSKDAFICQLENNSEILPPFLKIFNYDDIVPTSSTYYLHPASLHINPLCKALESFKNPWFSQNNALASFALNIVRYFSKTRYRCNVEFLEMYLNLEVRVREILEGMVVDLEKVGKTIFSDRRDQLALALAYARLLTKNQKTKAAIKVYSRILGIYENFSDFEKSNLKSIFIRDYTDLLILENRDNDKILRILACLALNLPLNKALSLILDKDPSSGLIEKCSEQFRKVSSSVYVGSEMDESKAAWIECACDFEYVINKKSKQGFSKLRKIFEEIIEFGALRKEEEVYYENLTIRYCDRLFKLCPSLMTPLNLHNEILKFLNKYPNNSHLLSLLILLNQQCTSLTRLSTSLYKISQKHNSCCKCWLACLCASTSKQSVDIHSYFGLGLGANFSKKWPIYWTLQMSYELVQGQGVEADLEKSEYERKRRAFLKSIQGCPWSKDLWMRGFQVLQRGNDGHEIAEFLNVMKDKGVNIRTDVYEILLENLSNTL